MSNNIEHIIARSPPPCVRTSILIGLKYIYLILFLSAIAIGFEFQSYQFDEPAVLTPISGEVLLIKEDQRETEQTFAIQVTVDNPLSPVLPATLQSADPSVQFDYARSAPGLVSSTYLIPPEAFFISFNFSLNDDNVTEGFEAFLAVSQPSPTFGTSFESPTNAFAITQIGIVDDDCESY